MIPDSEIRSPGAAAGGPKRARTLVAAVAMALSLACGGGGGGTPTSPPTVRTQTFSGTTESTAPGGCSPSANDFIVADGGTVQVRLDQSGDAFGLRVQVCAGGLDDNKCTINPVKIAIGATVSGVRKGGASQRVSFLRLGCSGGAPFVAGETTFTATVTYLAP